MNCDYFDLDIMFYLLNKNLMTVGTPSWIYALLLLPTLTKHAPPVMKDSKDNFLGICWHLAALGKMQNNQYYHNLTFLYCLL